MKASLCEPKTDYTIEQISRYWSSTMSCQQSTTRQLFYVSISPVETQLRIRVSRNAKFRAKKHLNIKIWAIFLKFRNCLQLNNYFWKIMTKNCCFIHEHVFDREYSVNERSIELLCCWRSTSSGIKCKIATKTDDIGKNE